MSRPTAGQSAINGKSRRFCKPRYESLGDPSLAHPQSLERAGDIRTRVHSAAYWISIYFVEPHGQGKTPYSVVPHAGSLPIDCWLRVTDYALVCLAGIPRDFRRVEPSLPIMPSSACRSDQAREPYHPWLGCSSWSLPTPDVEIKSHSIGDVCEGHLRDRPRETEMHRPSFSNSSKAHGACRQHDRRCASSRACSHLRIWIRRLPRVASW